MVALTPRQDAILRFIHQFIMDHNRPPSIREIGPHFGIRSLRGVTITLDALQRKGYINRNNPKRSIELNEEVYLLLGGPLLGDALRALDAQEAADVHKSTCRTCLSGRHCTDLEQLRAEARALRKSVLARPHPVRRETPDDAWTAMLQAVRRLDAPQYELPKKLYGERDAVTGLTPSETCILMLFAQGLTSKEVAARRRVSKRTIDYHACNIYRAMDADNRVKAIANARAKGILDSAEAHDKDQFAACEVLR